MDFIRDYWPQLLAFITLVMALTTMRVDIDVLKDKVKILFDLWNKEKKWLNLLYLLNTGELTALPPTPTKVEARRRGKGPKGRRRGGSGLR